MPKSHSWKRHPALNYRYQLFDANGYVVAEVERHDPPNNSHFSLWTLDNFTGHFSTLRDAKAYAERVRLKSGGN